MTDSLQAENARRMLTAAMNASVGIQILCESPVPVIAPALKAKQVLYRFKQENAEFRNLQIRLHPTDPDKRLWILKGNN